MPASAGGCAQDRGTGRLTAGVDTFEPVPGGHPEAAGRAAAVLLALDAVADAVLVIEMPSRERIYANTAALASLGLTHDQLRLPALAVDLPEGERERLRRVADEVALGGQAEAVVHTEMTLDGGRRVPLEVRVGFHPDGSGRAGHGHVIMIARDVSDRQAAEQRRRVSEESFRIAFDRAPIAKAVVRREDSGEHRVVRANQALADLLSVEIAEIVGRPLADRLCARDDLPDLLLALDPPHGQDFAQGELCLARADGGRVWVESRANRVDFPDLEGHTVLLHLVDVTERRRAERREVQRARMNAVLARITTEVLAGRPEREIYRLIVDGAAEVFQAADVALAFPGAGGVIEPAAWVGPVAAAVVEGVLPRSPGFLDQLRRHRVLAYPNPPSTLNPLVAQHFGPCAALRFAAGPTDGDLGVVALARRPGESLFTEAELELLVEFAAHLALAVDLGRARAAQARLSLLEDRQRIARDLHDVVLQDVISVGMQLVAGLDGARDDRPPPQAVIGQLNRAVRNLRATLTGLNPGAPDTMRALAREIVADAERALGFHPVLRLDGPVDTVPREVAHHAIAVLREAVSNVVRHAGAGWIEVTIRWDVDRLSLRVDDDGRGIGPNPGAGRGLVNMTHRARTLGGTLEVGDREPSGTRVAWTVPLPA